MQEHHQTPGHCLQEQVARRTVAQEQKKTACQLKFTLHSEPRGDMQSLSPEAVNPTTWAPCSQLLKNKLNQYTAAAWCSPVGAWQHELLVLDTEILPVLRSLSFMGCAPFFLSLICPPLPIHPDKYKSTGAWPLEQLERQQQCTPSLLHNITCT